jgi:formylglycine-generating enzyme required for sulfatase activity
VVTQAQYLTVMGKNPSRFKGAKLPVEMVSWHDAIEFCQKLSLKTGKNYRLPSEAEWEYACRAGTQTKHYFGDDPRHLEGCGWYNGNSHRKTHPVGLRSSNQFGLYDMQGNVWEWCADNWHDNYYLAPNDGTPWMNNDDRSRCVMRGGSWNDNTINCRSAFRNKFNADFSYNNIGFRLCI